MLKSISQPYLWGFEDRAQPYHVDAKVLEVVEPGNNPINIPQTISIRV